MFRDVMRGQGSFQLCLGVTKPLKCAMPSFDRSSSCDQQGFSDTFGVFFSRECDPWGTAERSGTPPGRD